MKMKSAHQCSCDRLDDSVGQALNIGQSVVAGPTDRMPSSAATLRLTEMTLELSGARHIGPGLDRFSYRPIAALVTNSWGYPCNGETWETCSGEDGVGELARCDSTEDLDLLKEIEKLRRKIRTDPDQEEEWSDFTDELDELNESYLKLKQGFEKQLKRARKKLAGAKSGSERDSARANFNDVRKRRKQKLASIEKQAKGLFSGMENAGTGLAGKLAGKLRKLANSGLLSGIATLTDLAINLISSKKVVKLYGYILSGDCINAPNFYRTHRQNMIAEISKYYEQGGIDLAIRVDLATAFVNFLGDLINRICCRNKPA